jgi:hypothetical protein
VKRAEALVLAAAVAAYLALSLIEWKTPGQVRGDTLSQEVFALAQIENVREGRPVTLWSRVYHGNTSGLLMIPYLWLFGRDWSVMRSWYVLFGVLTLFAGYFWTRRLCGTKAASIFVLLMAVHPTFVFGTREGNSHVSSTIFFSTAALYFLTRWWDAAGRRTGRPPLGAVPVRGTGRPPLGAVPVRGTGRPPLGAVQARRTEWDGVLSLAAAGLLLGLGLGTKFWFGWFAAGLTLSALFLLPGIRRRLSPPRVVWRQAAAALGGFLAGSAPIWLVRFEGMSSLDVLREQVAAGPAPGSGAWTSMLRGSWQGFLWMLDGRAFYWDIFTRHPFSLANAAYPAAFLAAFAWLTFSLWKEKRTRTEGAGRGPGSSGGEAFPALLLAAVMLLGATTYKTLLRHHLFIIYPLPLIVVAAALARLRSRRAAGRLASTALIALLMAKDLQACAGYYVMMRNLGGLGHFTDAIYGVAEWVRDSAPGSAPLVLGDATSRKCLIPLTKGVLWGVHPYFDPGPLSLPDAHEALDHDLGPKGLLAAARRDEVLFIRRRWPPRGGVQNRSEDFFRRAREIGVTFRLRRTFHDGDGVPAYDGFVGRWTGGPPTDDALRELLHAWFDLLLALRTDLPDRPGAAAGALRRREAPAGGRLT